MDPVDQGVDVENRQTGYRLHMRRKWAHIRTLKQNSGGMRTLLHEFAGHFFHLGLEHLGIQLNAVADS